MHASSLQEIRYRNRYLDLLTNPDVRNIFKTRARIVTYLRRYFDSKGFIEVGGKGQVQGLGFVVGSGLQCQLFLVVPLLRCYFDSRDDINNIIFHFEVQG